jgi:hypothetical protein
MHETSSLPPIIQKKKKESQVDDDDDYEREREREREENSNLFKFHCNNAIRCYSLI